MSDLWKRLGFSQNPYFATPLDISREGTDLFVGRTVEVRRLVNKWSSAKTGGITVIAGNIGTGKTSFLNVCQYLCLTGVPDFELPFDPPLIIPSTDRVQLEDDQTEGDLLLRLIRAAANSIRWACNHHGDPVPATVSATLDWLDSTTGAETRTAGGGVNLSGPLIPVGGGLNVTKTTGTTRRNPADLTVDSLIARFTAIAGEASQVRSYTGLVVAIDNIEMVSTEKVVAVLNKYRDTLFSIPGVWWVLIGQRGLYELIEADAPRVSQRIQGTETTLDGLAWEDFLLAIQARMSAFKLRQDAVGPVDETLLRVLFDTSHGEIRYIFKIAEQIVTDAIAEDPKTVSVPPERAQELLKKSVSDQYRRFNLSDREIRVLRMLCERGSARPKDYKEFGIQNAPHFIQGALQPLQTKGLIGRSTEGNAAVYSPRPPAVLAHSFDLLVPRQRSLLEDPDDIPT